MPPKAAPKFEQLYASFTKKVEDFDKIKGYLDTLGELPDKFLRKLGEINKAIEKLWEDMERTNPYFESEYPDVWTEWSRIFFSLLKLRVAKEKEVRTAADLNKKEEQIDSTVSSLVAEEDFEEPDHYDVPTVRSDHYEDHTGEADHYEAHKGEADHYEATLERTDQTDVDLVLVKEEPATKKAAAAPVAKKAAAEEERFPEKESSGGEEKPAARPAAKPVASKEERNSDSNSEDLKDEKPASEGVKPTAKPAMKEEPPDDNSADGSNDVKKPEAKKAKKLAPGDPMDEEDAVKAIDEAVMYKLDQAKIHVDYQAKPYEHVEKYVKGPTLVALQAEEVELAAASQEREQVSVEVAPQEKEEKEKVTIEVAPEEKEASAHSSLSVVASQERKAVDVASQEEERVEADADVASGEREGKEGVDTKVDATRLDKTMEVSSDEENHPVEEKQAKTDESFDENENEVETQNDEKSNDYQANENDDHSKENDEVNGNKYDQVKIEKLYESIAIFLFFPNYKYRKKRWPGKT